MARHWSLRAACMLLCLLCVAMWFTSYQRIMLGINTHSAYGIYLRNGEIYALWTDSRLTVTGPLAYYEYIPARNSMDSYIDPSALSIGGFGQGEMVFWHWLAAPCWSLMALSLGLLWWTWNLRRKAPMLEEEPLPVLTAWDVRHTLA